MIFSRTAAVREHAVSTQVGAFPTARPVLAIQCSETLMFLSSSPSRTVGSARLEVTPQTYCVKVMRASLALYPIPVILYLQWIAHNSAIRTRISDSVVLPPGK